MSNGKYIPEVGDRVRVKRARFPNSNWDDCVGKVVSVSKIGDIIHVKVLNPNFLVGSNDEPIWGFFETSLERF